MPDVTELIGLDPRVGDEKKYVDDPPFASAGELRLWNIMERGCSIDQAVGVAIIDVKRNRGILIDSKDIPVLFDLLRGIVERNPGMGR